MPVSDPSPPGRAASDAGAQDAAKETLKQLLLHPDVKEATLRRLRRYRSVVPELEDGYQDVWVLILEWDGGDDTPTTLEGAKALSMAVADRYAISELRKKKRRERRGNAGPTDVPDEYVAPEKRRWDIVEAQELWEELERAIPEDVLEMLVDHGAGMSQKEVAEKHGKSHREVRDLFKKWRSKAHYVAVAAGIAAIVWFVVKQVDFGGPPKVARPSPPDTQSTPEEPQEPTPGTPEAKVRATELREQAKAQCAAEQWKQCLWSYDRANGLDVERETPEVKAAHDRAREEVRKRER
jgi:DNA-directed RNA polymerase specialized sigma24 family protein